MHRVAMADKKNRIVIIGAGFGGLAAAREFEHIGRYAPGAEVLMLDKNNYHLFTPLLYQVGSGGIEPGNICFPMRSMLEKGGTLPPVMFRECEVLEVDTEHRKLHTSRCDCDYDYLIFAPGSTTNYYGMSGLDKTTMPLKTIRDGMRMHYKILESFETALLEQDEQRRKALLAIVIVGGGATGVEVASTVAVFVFKTLARDFPGLVKQARVVLIEASDGLLRGMPAQMGRKALERLTARGVEVLLNCQVAGVDSTAVHTRDGRSIPTCNVTWVAGVKPAPLADKLPAEKSKDGRIMVNEVFEARGLPGVYVIGDCAYMMQYGDGAAYPPTAQVALREGRACARGIVQAIMGLPPCPFNYSYRGELVFLGRDYAVGQVGGRVIDGMPAFWMYQTYYLNKLAGFKRKATTAIDWAYDFFYRRNTAKLE